MLLRSLLHPLRHAAAVLALLLCATGAHAITLTFDDAIAGRTTYSFDQNSDGIVDAVFSTADPSGFNTAGPGANMSFIREPGLEGTTSIAPDLRVEFPLGAVGSLEFGFAMSAGSNLPTLTVTFNIYDAANNLLATTTVLAAYTQPVAGTNSNFPEARVTLPFAGTARYATLDFNSAGASRYIIDNFTGTFGSDERPVPSAAAIPTLSEWSLIILSVMLAGGALLALHRRAD
jgi:hypothetical protein